VAVNRDAEERAGALGSSGRVKVVDDDGTEKPRPASTPRVGSRMRRCRRRDREHRRRRPVRGYYNNPDATEKTTRFGWYWSGDLGYLDPDGYLYFAGRTADWIRVDGENFPRRADRGRAAPSSGRRAQRGVRRARRPAGDQVMASLVLRDGAELDPSSFARVGRRARGRRTEVAAPLRARAA